MGLKPASAINVKTDRDSMYRAPRGDPELVRVPPMQFLMIDGAGDPNTSPAYRDAIAALYSVSYGLRFAVKRETGVADRVGPLEGLWWAADMSEFAANRQTAWEWTMMIAQPAAVTDARLVAAQLDLRRKRKDVAGLEKLRLEPFDEGLCAQVLHVGPFSTEGPAIERLHGFIHDLGYTFDGRTQKHHEIYLSDPRRSAPATWKTIIRQPIAEPR